MKTQQMKELAKPSEEQLMIRKNTPIGVDVNKVNERNKKYYEEGKEIARNERKTLEITKDFRFWKKGYVIRPAVALADELITSKSAKEITLKKDERIKNGKIVKVNPVSKNK